jgi:hypothetical protein
VVARLRVVTFAETLSQQDKISLCENFLLWVGLVVDVVVNIFGDFRTLLAKNWRFY